MRGEVSGHSCESGLQRRHFPSSECPGNRPAEYQEGGGVESRGEPEVMEREQALTGLLAQEQAKTAPRDGGTGGCTGPSNRGR